MDVGPPEVGLVATARRHDAGEAWPPAAIPSEYVVL
jgi:hypothetical protein